MHTPAARTSILHFASAAMVLAAGLFPASTPASAEETVAGGVVMKPQVTGSSIATIALANVGMGACSANTLGGTSYGTSCTGNGGYPEYWCADFALWVWASAGVANVSGLDAAAGSFYTYGQNNGTLSDTPAVGDAVVFDYAGGGVADHVAIVTQVNSDGTIESVSGDWGGTGSTEAAFASTSAVVFNEPAYASTVGTAPSIMGMTISGYIAPVGVGAASDYGASYVSQSFPLAATALTMTAGQTIPSYIELKNTGTKAWDTSTRLGTTQPRDRVSAFVDSSWIASNRPAAVTGAVAPGDTYKFAFDLHAPATPGTYFEYFGVVEDGVAWFSDPGEGGPVDDDLEVQIVVVAGASNGDDAGAVASAGDGGVSGPTSAADGGRAGTNQPDDAGAAASPGSAGEAPSIGAPTGAGSTGSTSGAGTGITSTGGDGGCALSPAPARSAFGWLFGVAALGLLAARRREPRAAARAGSDA